MLLKTRLFKTVLSLIFISLLVVLFVFHRTLINQKSVDQKRLKDQDIEIANLKNELKSTKDTLDGYSLLELYLTKDNQRLILNPLKKTFNLALQDTPKSGVILAGSYNDQNGIVTLHDSLSNPDIPWFGKILSFKKVFKYLEPAGVELSPVSGLIYTGENLQTYPPLLKGDLYQNFGNILQFSEPPESK